jgi:RNA polymerase sigma-70 factor (ECF subfamily)
MSLTVSIVSDEREFARLAGPLRREILTHCYRMLGSVVDAEDAVQETYLRAWRAFDGFEGRSSLRVWLHQIATNACLRAIEQRGRRAVPSGLGAPEEAWQDPLRLAPAQVQWVEPLPTDPADIVGRRQHVRLAFVAAVQHLAARQRAVLILRDVVGLRAYEVAGILGTTTVAVNSALRRARAHLQRLSPKVDEVGEPDDPSHRALLDRYVAAFHDADLTALAAVLRDDVTLEMPPYASWFAGRTAVTGFFGAQVLSGPGQFRLLAADVAGRLAANGQPTFVAYLREPDGGYHIHALHVLDVTAGGIGQIHVFMQPALFPLFRLPSHLPE